MSVHTRLVSLRSLLFAFALLALVFGSTLIGVRPALAAEAVPGDSVAPARATSAATAQAPAPEVDPGALDPNRHGPAHRPLISGVQRPVVIGRPSAAQVARIGEAVPGDRAPITAANFDQLAQVAQWGRGSLLAVAYAPDGATLVAGSAFGLAFYDLNNLTAEPSWVPFDPPVYYQSLAFSAGGQYLLLEGYEFSQVRQLPDGAVVSRPADLTWLRPSTLDDYSQELVSPDGARQLDSYYYYPDVAEPDNYYMLPSLVVSRTVLDAATGRALFTLPDATFYVTYDDVHPREGCDLASFSMCGNAYEPSAMSPYRLATASDQSSLAILYRARDYGNPRGFSTLRVYDGATGQLRSLIGSFSDPVENFAYAPDGRSLAVAFADGTLRLWDLATNAPTFGARHFNNYAFDLDYSADGAFLLLQTPDELIVRRTSDGGLRGRYAANTFAASPVENVVALGHNNGALQLLDLASGTFLYDLAAHTDGISSLAFSPDGQLLVSAGLDCVIREWAAETGEFVHNFQENWTDAYGFGDTLSRIFIDALQFIPGTDQLLGYGSWSRVVSWDTNSGATEYLIEPEPLEYYHGMMTLNPHFPEFFGLDEAAGMFYVDSQGYAIADGEAVGEWEPPAGLPEGRAPSGPLTTDGALRFTRGYDSHKGAICVLDAATLALKGTITVIAPDAPTAGALGWLYLSPDGGQLAVTVGGESVYVYQIAP